METNRVKRKEKIVDIDILQILKTLWEKAWAIILSAAIFAGAAFLWTYYLIQPKYEADVMFYVNNTSISVGNVGVSISSSDLTAAQKLVNTYVVILKTRMTLDDVIKESGVDMSYSELSGHISAKAVNSTEVFKVVVWDHDPYQAENIANTIARILPDKIASVVDGSSVKIVETAVVPTHRSSPSYSRNTMIGFLIGAVLAMIIILIAKYSDPYIKNEEYITQNYDLPLLAVIPKVRNDSDGKYSYSYNSYNRDRH